MTHRRAGSQACHTRPERLLLSSGRIEFENQVRTLRAVHIRGTIINSITEHKNKLLSWKQTVASAIKGARCDGPWDPAHTCAVTLEFWFHPANHGHQKLDVENFIKPVLDAVAAGLFVSDATDIAGIQHWNFDDSNFRSLLIRRCPDPPSVDCESVRVSVSAQE